MFLSIFHPWGKNLSYYHCTIIILLTKGHILEMLGVILIMNFKALIQIWRWTWLDSNHTILINFTQLSVQYFKMVSSCSDEFLVYQERTFWKFNGGVLISTYYQ